MRHMTCRDRGETMLGGEVRGRSTEGCLAVYLWPEDDRDVHVHINGVFTGVFRRNDMREFTSIEVITITGRGELHVLADESIAVPGELLGQDILLDGQERTVTGVESTSSYRPGDAIGVLIR